MTNLKYKNTPPSEGGSAIAGCGTIHISEIKETLSQLGTALNFAVDLNECVLGSTGKRDYSGDIDLVLDKKWCNYEPVDFFHMLVEKFGKDSVAKNGTMVHLKWPITDYKSELAERLPRTGFVQVDFNFGDTEWEKFYHYSPGDQSGYKGAHRNLMLAAICASIRLESSTEVDTYNRPLRQVRWRFGPNGLSLVIRNSVRDSRTNIWMKKQQDSVIEGPYFSAEKISSVLFPLDGKPEDLHSLESIMLAVKRNYGMTDQERIWKRSASNFWDWSFGRYFEYPIEIARYFSLNDK